MVFGKTGGLSISIWPTSGPATASASMVPPRRQSRVLGFLRGRFQRRRLRDLIIGAPYADPDGRTDAGSAYVIFGKASGFGDIDLANLSAADGFRIDGSPGFSVIWGSASQPGFSVAQPAT